MPLTEAQVRQIIQGIAANVPQVAQAGINIREQRQQALKEQHDELIGKTKGVLFLSMGIPGLFLALGMITPHQYLNFLHSSLYIWVLTLALSGTAYVALSAYSKYIEYAGYANVIVDNMFGPVFNALMLPAPHIEVHAEAPPPPGHNPLLGRILDLVHDAVNSEAVATIPLSINDAEDPISGGVLGDFGFVLDDCIQSPVTSEILVQLYHPPRPGFIYLGNPFSNLPLRRIRKVNIWRYSETTDNEEVTRRKTEYTAAMNAAPAPAPEAPAAAQDAEHPTIDDFLGMMNNANATRRRGLADLPGGLENILNAMNHNRPEPMTLEQLAAATTDL